MTPEERSLLEKTLKLAEENNKILHGLRRYNRSTIILRVIYWVLIIGLSIGAFYAVQPLMNSVPGLLETLKTDMNLINGVSQSAQSIPSLLNK